MGIQAGGIQPDTPQLNITRILSPVVFSSTIFLFLFLPIVLVGYYLTPTTRLRNSFLLISSLFFYAWGEGIYLGLMLLSIIVNYAVGIVVSKLTKAHLRTLSLSCGILFNLALLGFFKYANFAVGILNTTLQPLGFPTIPLSPVHLPIGISFFTFQAISYIVDVYKKDAEVQLNPLDCGLYIALFPQLIAGPIVRYHDISRQIGRRKHTTLRFTNGITLFICGLAKKMLIDNPMGAIADQVFLLPSHEISPLLAWSGILAYTLQIYFDFSGYSDMAIGLGRMFGFELLINFNYPYIASSFREFWQRWHISLSRWFRDYLYIPLGGNRYGPWRTGLNLFIVFFLCGLWHGAGWNFILWGLLHGSFLVAERGAPGKILLRLWSPARHIYVLVCVMLAWVFFRTETLQQALDYLGAMFSLSSDLGYLHPPGLYWNRYTILTCLIGMLAATPFFAKCYKYASQPLSLSLPGRAILGSFQVGGSMLLLLFCAMELAAGTHNPFIYFRF